MKKKIKWRSGAALRGALNGLARKRSNFDRAGKELVKKCGGTVFPADLYFLGTCNRALQNFDAFGMAMKADYYSTAMILLRVQLDSVLRCFGLFHTIDPHAAALQVLQGSKLSDLKDKNEKKLTDSYLVGLLSEQSEANKVILHIYKLSSGYVHLSGAALNHVLEKATSTDTGSKKFFIGSSEPEVPIQAKLELVTAFGKITEAWIDLASTWSQERGQFGHFDDLKNKYGPKS